MLLIKDSLKTFASTFKWQHESKLLNYSTKCCSLLETFHLLHTYLQISNPILVVPLFYTYHQNVFDRSDICRSAIFELVKIHNELYFHNYELRVECSSV